MNKVALVVAAHPDDEVLGCGGMMAGLTQNGWSVYVLFLADGESSRFTKNEDDLGLIRERKKQAIRANEVLGSRDISFLSYPDNQMDSVPLLSVIKDIESYIRKIKPDLLLTHFGGDLNIDHRVANQATVTACRPIMGSSVKTLLYFEIPSSTEWGSALNESKFQPNYFVDIENNFDIKKSALSCYGEEMMQPPHPRSINVIESLARVRGSMAGMGMAEAFMVGRINKKL